LFLAEQYSVCFHVNIAVLIWKLSHEPLICLVVATPCDPENFEMIRTAFALAAAALLSAAPAAAQEVRVPFADLDLSSVSGVQAFDARAAAAARGVCAAGPRALVNDNCVRRVQKEAVRALPATRQDDYARARRGGRVLAMIAPAWPA
jgi:UrcA family protein